MRPMTPMSAARFNGFVHTGLVVALIVGGLAVSACDDDTSTTSTDSTMADGSDDMTAAPDTMEPDTRADDTRPPDMVSTTAGLCAPCTTSEECGGADDLCVTGPNSQFCGLDCRTAPCPGGYTCTELAPGFSQCTPDAGECGEPCGDVFCNGSQTCDAATGTCVAKLELCDLNCTDDSLCGLEADLCVSLAASGELICARDCSADPDSCPADYICASVSDDVSQCVPSRLTCVDRCQNSTCPDGQICDPFTGFCSLPLGLCDGPCFGDDLCGSGPEDVCVSLAEDETVCALDCNADPTVCPTGYMCIEINEDIGNKCVPVALTCTDQRCAGVNCPANQQCDPATGMCVASLGLCEGPCNSNNACLGPDDLCVSFDGQTAFCSENCSESGRCPLGFGCLLLNAGGSYCIPSTQTCEFGGSTCTYEGRFADCPGGDVFCSAVRPGDEGTCVPRCDNGTTCPSSLPHCADLHVHPSVCLPGEPNTATSCGRYGPTDNDVGRPCGDNLLAFCPAPTDICYDAPDVAVAPFCTYACTSDDECGDGASCQSVPDRMDAICVPDPCASCLRDPGVMGGPDLLDTALFIADISRCELAIEDDALALADPALVSASPVVPSFERLWRQPIAATDMGRSTAAAVDSALAGPSPARDSLLAAAMTAGYDLTAPASGTMYPIDPTQPLAAAVAALITSNGATPDVAALEADAADVPMDLQNALAPVIYAMGDAMALRPNAFPEPLSGGAAQELFDAGHAHHFRIDPTLTAPALANQFIQSMVQDFDAGPLLDGSALILGEIEAQSAGLVTNVAWGSFDFTQDTPLGQIIIVGNEDSVHDATGNLANDIALFVDSGGDDLYRIPAGANTSIANGVAVHLDLGGSDTYTYAEVADPNDGSYLPSDGVGRYQPTLPLNQEDGAVSLSSVNRQGAGRLGVAVLYDAGTAIDTYRSLRLSQGFGLFGVGVLVDAGGADIYDVEAAGQGAAIQGAGLVIDLGGDDTYTGWSAIQGSGMTNGLGALVDADGADVYTAVPGQANGLEVLYFNLLDRARSNLSLAQGAGSGLGATLGDGTIILGGGLGLLRDAGAGNDSYTAAVLAQGAGVDRGLGYLLDAAGNETYDGRRYMQGSGLTLAAGVFIDESGDDLYNTTLDRVSLGHGLGEEIALGVLIDDDGGDTHTLFTTAGGVGVGNGIGILADHAGDDTYTVSAEQSLGYAATSISGVTDPAREAVQTLGFFLETGGTDIYEPAGTVNASAANNANWESSADITVSRERGVAVDAFGGTGL